MSRSHAAVDLSRYRTRSAVTEVGDLKRLVVLLAIVVSAPVGLAVIVASVPQDETSAPSRVAEGEIPSGLLTIYMAAADRCPGLPWQVLAGIGSVESGHGAGRYDPVTGNVLPPIVGPAIDGRPGFATIGDRSQPDGWAHALAPCSSSAPPGPAGPPLPRDARRDQFRM